MVRRTGRLLWIALAGASGFVSGQTILWSSDPNALNKTSSGQLMDADFRFELGVFAGTFDPASENMTSWAANWNPMQRTAYNPLEKRYDGSFTAADNDAPFLEGKAVYVWGFRGDATAGEWILFRASAWTFPNANFPSSYQWFPKNAAPVLGVINFSGILMQSAAVTNAAPPATTWAQWQADNLTGETQAGPNDDPDHDGTPNLLEFVFGTPPKTAGAPVATPVALVGGHLQITIPRRIDHPADLTVEVSGDLLNWYSGASHTQTVTESPASLVVSDLTPLDTAHPKRFIRLRAGLP